MEWKKPVLSVIISMAIGSILIKLSFKALDLIDYEDSSTLEYLRHASTLLSVIAVCFIECLIALYITDSKEKLVVWVITILNTLGLIVIALFIGVFTGGHYLLPFIALLCLLVPHFALKHGRNITDKILNKMRGLAAEVED